MNAASLVSKYYKSYQQYVFKDSIEAFVDSSVPFRLLAFYHFLTNIAATSKLEFSISSIVKKLHLYDAFLVEQDVFSAMVTADFADSFDNIDHGMLVACYGEVNYEGKAIYNRCCLYNALKSTDFYDKAILDGSIDKVLRELDSHTNEDYRHRWYSAVLEAIDAKRHWLANVKGNNDS